MPWLSGSLCARARKSTWPKFAMLARLLLLLTTLLSAAYAEEEKAPFNKDELEQLLKKEHSQRVSNIYDSEAGIQCAPCHATRVCAVGCDSSGRFPRETCAIASVQVVDSVAAGSTDIHVRMA